MAFWGYNEAGGEGERRKTLLLARDIMLDAPHRSTQALGQRMDAPPLAAASVDQRSAHKCLRRTGAHGWWSAARQLKDAGSSGMLAGMDGALFRRGAESDDPGAIVEAARRLSCGCVNGWATRPD
ncbi:hypothetical protein VE03_01300 [Pseudogymnoascus sp. 23342-1-I1]|nr:hypothetical protein VE03_01300 [Pseudogymnoascus sp. 23342-1-I1]